MTLSNKERQRLKTKYGDWAIVTGASSGIGLELATQLATAGFNLVITSRHVDNLQDVEEQLKANSNIQIKIVASDVSNKEGIDKNNSSHTRPQRWAFGCFSRLRYIRKFY